MSSVHCLVLWLPRSLHLMKWPAYAPTDIILAFPRTYGRLGWSPDAWRIEPAILTHSRRSTSLYFSVSSQTDASDLEGRLELALYEYSISPTGFLGAFPIPFLEFHTSRYAFAWYPLRVTRFDHRVYILWRILLYLIFALLKAPSASLNDTYFH